MRAQNERAAALRLLILQLSNRPGGMSTSEINGHTQTAVHNAIQKMCRLGLLHRGRLSHLVVRYFTSDEAAARYERTRYSSDMQSLPTTGPAVGFKRREPTTAPRGSGRAWWPADAPMNITPQTKWTFAPTPPAPTRTNTFSFSA